MFTEADLNKIYSVATANYYCECGGKAAGMEDHTCTPVIWKNWTNATQNPNVAGNWKLTTSTKSGQITDFAGELHIDLNGYNIESTGRVFGGIKGVVSITDTHTVTDEKPLGVMNGTHKDQGGTISISNGASFTLYNGVMTNPTVCTHTGGGAVVYIADGGTFTMYGGSVTDGKSQHAAGNIRVIGKCYIYGGVVANGLSGALGDSGKHGGNIYVNGANAELVVKNATIQNGGKLRADYLDPADPYYKMEQKPANGDTTYFYFRECYGGNIAVTGSGAKVFEIGEGAVISGGSAHRGGNIYIGELTSNNDTEYKITGGTISGGKKGHRGANIAMYCADAAKPSTLYISGGQIIGASAADETISLGCGGGSYATMGNIVMTGGEIKNGKITVIAFPPLIIPQVVRLLL